jgi:pimeloyl-ACP methyl ester carboxylesterase
MSPITANTAAGVSYLARSGRGTPIVLLHGIGSRARSFVPLMEALDPRFSVIAWDAPGYGDSSPLPVEAPDASDYAAALNRFLAELDISHCILIGHSLGALVAARLAVVSTNRVATLALLSPALGYGADRNGPLPSPVAARLEELDRFGAEAFAAKRAPGLVADPAGRPDVLQQVERAMAEVRRPGYDQAARMLASGRLLKDAAHVAVPTGVWVGEHDRITPPANARQVFEALPPPARRAYGEIAGAGHAVCQERPADLAKAILSLADDKASMHA